MTTKNQAFAESGDITTAEKFANNTWRWYADNRYGNPVEFIRLHHTDVVTRATEGVMLNTDGWMTVTTKERMSQFVQVWQEKGRWLVSHNGEVRLYEDGMLLLHTGNVLYPNEPGYDAVVKHFIAE